MSTLDLHTFAPRYSLFDRIAARVRVVRAHQETARQLAMLSDERLRDIGVDHRDVSQQIANGLARIDSQRLGRIGLL